MRIIIWRYGYVTGVHTSLVNSTRYKIDPIQYTHPGLLFSVTLHNCAYYKINFINLLATCSIIVWSGISPTTLHLKG